MDQYANDRPSSVQGGIIARDHLLDGETLHWEGRPGIGDYLATPVMWIVLTIPILIMGRMIRDSAVGTWVSIGGAILLAIGVIYLILAIIDWYHTSYAITDRRVMATRGAFSRTTAECYHDAVQVITISTSWASSTGHGNISFSTAAHGGGLDILGNAAGAITWRNIYDPYGVRRHISEVLEASHRPPVQDTAP